MNGDLQDHKWHLVSYDKVLEILNTSSEGLSSAEAARRQKEIGFNILQRQGRENAFKVLLKQFRNPLIYILLAATILAVIMGKITDGIVVFSVIVINAIIGFIQEFQAGRDYSGTY